MSAGQGEVPTLSKAVATGKPGREDGTNSTSGDRGSLTLQHAHDPH